MSILKRLGLVASSTAASDGVLAPIERMLSRLEPRRAQLVACFAGLLARVAYADDAISDVESAAIARLVEESAGLPPGEAEAIAAIAGERTVALRGADSYVLTRRFNEVATDEDKRRLVECLYALAASDDVATHVEDREVRRIAAALLVPDKEVLEIRARYRDKLEELRELKKLRGENRREGR
jgi:uncharacterized tellurite resistance protein B-like protein